MQKRNLLRRAVAYQLLAFRYALGGIYSRANNFATLLGPLVLWVIGLVASHPIDLPGGQEGQLEQAILAYLAAWCCIFLWRYAYFVFRSTVSKKKEWRLYLALMWIGGIGAFVGFVTFGIGAIWFLATQPSQTLAASVVIAPPATSPSPTVAPQMLHVEELAKPLDLSFEDKQYRIDARKFVVSDLQPAINAFTNIIAEPGINAKGALEENGPKESKAHYRFATDYFSESQFVKVSDDLFIYAKQPTERIDPILLSSKIEKVIQQYYHAQSLIFFLHLKEIGGQNEEDLYKKWLGLDENAYAALVRLKDSTTKFLEKLDPNQMGSRNSLK